MNKSAFHISDTIQATFGKNGSIGIHMQFPDGNGQLLYILLPHAIAAPIYAQYKKAADEPEKLEAIRTTLKMILIPLEEGAEAMCLYAQVLAQLTEKARSLGDKKLRELTQKATLLHSSLIMGRIDALLQLRTEIEQLS